MTIEPHAKRRGRLKNGAPGGDPSKAPRCGACTRASTLCRAPAMANGRCRMHGGASTGPRTEDGLRRLRAARTTHGFWTPESREFRHYCAVLLTNARTWLAVTELGRAVRRPKHLQRASSRMWRDTD
ncbi:MAG: HGGxSTG domain-containing protein [Acetobacteraceae bacterium]